MGCDTCHSVSGRPELREGVDPEMNVMLGGETTRIATYGELVTSIINPSHKLARGLPQEQVSDNGVSKMTNYNDALTVTQLIDLVAFFTGSVRHNHTGAPDLSALCLLRVGFAMKSGDDPAG